MEEVLILDDLGTDEALLEVGVDSSSGTRRLAALGVGPGTYLLHPSGEVSLQIEELVSGLDQTRHARLL